METLNIPSWRAEITQAKAPVLQLSPGQKVVLAFRNEGEEFKHPSFKKAVVFSVYVENDGVKRWFVRSQKLLKQIYELGPILSGMKVELTRYGNGIETTYVVKKVE